MRSGFRVDIRDTSGVIVVRCGRFAGGHYTRYFVRMGVDKDRDEGKLKSGYERCKPFSWVQFESVGHMTDSSRHVCMVATTGKALSSDNTDDDPNFLLDIAIKERY